MSLNLNNTDIGAVKKQLELLPRRVTSLKSDIYIVDFCDTMYDILVKYMTFDIKKEIEKLDLMLNKTLDKLLKGVSVNDVMNNYNTKFNCDSIRDMLMVSNLKREQLERECETQEKRLKLTLSPNNIFSAIYSKGVKSYEMTSVITNIIKEFPDGKEKTKYLNLIIKAQQNYLEYKEKK
jgi:hypothetical protein